MVLSKHLTFHCPQNPQLYTEVWHQLGVWSLNLTQSALGDWLNIVLHDTLASCNIWISDLLIHNKDKRLSRPFGAGAGPRWCLTFLVCSQATKSKT